ncbi:hypothetical protein G3A_07080 [Bacillus sp. 17376]|uniref:helix-turn-helix transcriptional regulator n=1 Tax=Mesobacillus boroniphilus TaxID=308892 RepID=UPI0003C7CC80|nr:helix-turn-helix transcriptional regulator [Mesobacillus boroniphilus]ESU33275.1 hypothetical protein G3A_07080 [Bacillus sp. 17376]
MFICRIEELVKNSGLKKGFIADRLGVSVKQFRNYETGHSLIPIDKAFLLAGLLGCKVDDLYKFR